MAEGILETVDEFMSRNFSSQDSPVIQNNKEPREKARRLLRQVLPEKTWQEFERKGFIRLKGKRGSYVISERAQTKICYGIFIAHGCLQLSIPAPAFDRMVAEYLLILNAEDVYWNKANLFPVDGEEFNIPVLFMIAFDIALFLGLLLVVIR